MAVGETIELDLERIDRLIEEEEAKLEPKHRASSEYREVAVRTVTGGVASSRQAAPPHAIFVDHGQGSHLWDIDGNEYVDFHLGYGVMVVGHAHPRIVEAVERQIRRGSHFAQPTKGLDVVGENLVDRFGLALWRFCNSGTEATLEAARLMRAVTGRDLIIKIEGSYHGHDDSLMFSVVPDPEKIGPREHPFTLPQVLGIPQVFAELVRVVPFNDLAEVERAFAENEGKVAGMIVEPAMINCGVIMPEPGYLQGLKDLCHRNGALLTFDEVKTGATEEAFSLVAKGETDMAGTFNGNPLTMAASKATRTEILTKGAYDHLNEIHRILSEGCTAAIERHRLPAYVTGVGAKGSVIYSATPVREYRNSAAVAG
jgi:glutamate-1-semialdehyde 2,1-aminomutase